MRVLYITHATDLAGANRSMLQMIVELSNNHGVAPFVVFPKISKDLNFNIKEACLKYHIPFLEHRMTNFKRHQSCTIVERIYYVILQFYVVICLLLKLWNKNFDLVHTNSSVNDTGCYLSMLFHLPHVWHLREFGEKDFGLVSCLGNWYEKWVYKHGGSFIAISNAVKNYYMTKIDPINIYTIYNGILPPDQKYISSHNRDIVNFCIVGRVERNKNQLEVLKAMSIILRKKLDATKFYLTIIGREEPSYKEELINYINSNNLVDFVKFLGPRNDVQYLLSNMDVGLMLSTSEAFGRSTIEYMMHGLAVIATDTGANCELVQSGVTGYTYPLGDANALSEIMEKFIEYPLLLKEISTRGMDFAIKYFTSTKNSNNVYNLYHNILG